ncbi:hypothetical protein [Desulfovibrio legallii]|uniref:hypothetical protein n=2 Tax=Desulfovibrio legallii TaxID=571438 RepID=UPI0013EEF3A0|nr:hypothetical protein [Desulfovibrio legallii]
MVVQSMGDVALEVWQKIFEMEGYEDIVYMLGQAVGATEERRRIFGRRWAALQLDKDIGENSNKPSPPRPASPQRKIFVGRRAGRSFFQRGRVADVAAERRTAGARLEQLANEMS